MQNPYFSIIIPTLNEEKYLPNLLNDLKKQKASCFETIIIDGNSVDKTCQVVEKFKKILPITFLKINKRNVAHQRNLGASKARGAYIIFLDADSRINVYFINKIKKEINRKKSLIFLPAIFPQEKSYQTMLIYNIANFIIEVSQTLSKPLSSGGSMIFQKDYFHFLGGFNEKFILSEDHEIIQRAKASGVIAHFLKNIKVKCSLRRLKKEGRMTLLKKHLIASIHALVKGGMNRKMFNYEMGGGHYKLKNKQPSFERKMKEQFLKAKKQLEKFSFFV